MGPNRSHFSQQCLCWPGVAESLSADHVKPYFVSLPRTKCSALYRFPATGRSLTPRVWYSEKPMGVNSLKKVVKNLAERAGLTLAAPRHLDGDCKGTVTGSYQSNLDWVWLGGTGSVQSIRAFCALVSPALMGAERISCGFLWGGVYFSAGEVLRTAVEKLALLIYMSTTAIEVNISKSVSMLFDVIWSA